MDDLVSKYGKKEEKSLDTNGVVNIFDKYFSRLVIDRLPEREYDDG